MSKFVKEQTNLKIKNHVILASKNFGDNDMQLFCRSQDTYKIQRLSMFQNQIGYDGMVFFARASWNNLTYLNLLSNKIGAKGCKILSKTTINNLLSLNISSNQIGSTGLFHLSKAQWRKLQQLLISLNRIETGIRWIINANWKIIKLYIRENKLPRFQVLNLVLSQSNQYRTYLTQSKWINFGNGRDIQIKMREKFPFISLWF